MAQTVKNPSAMQETWVSLLGQEDSLEKGMATHSSILAQRVPWTEEPGGPQSVGRTELDTTERLALDSEMEALLSLSAHTSHHPPTDACTFCVTFRWSHVPATRSFRILFLSVQGPHKDWKRVQGRQGVAERLLTVLALKESVCLIWLGSLCAVGPLPDQN